jgi:hypothetical protein
MIPIAPFHLEAADTCGTKPVSSCSTSSSSSVSVLSCNKKKDTIPCMPSRTKRLDSFEFEEDHDQEPQALSRKELLSIAVLQKGTPYSTKEETRSPSSFWKTTSTTASTSTSSSNHYISLENLDEDEVQQYDNDKFHSTGALELPTSSCHTFISESSLSEELSTSSCHSSSSSSFPFCKFLSENNTTSSSLSEIPNLESFCHHGSTHSSGIMMNFLVDDSMTSFASFCPADALAASVVDLQLLEETQEEEDHHVTSTTKTATTTTTTEADTTLPPRPCFSNMPPSKPSCLKLSTASNLYGSRPRRETRWANGNDSSSDSLPSLKRR